MPRNASTSSGIATITSHAPSANFVQITTSVTTPVAVAPTECRSPDLAQDRPVRHQLALVLGEDTQDAELERRQMNGLAVDGDRRLLEIDPDRADLEHRLTRRPRAAQDS